MQNVERPFAAEVGFVRAPDFALPDQSRKIVELHDYFGKWVVLFFYPMDNTPGCTLEAKDFSSIAEKPSEMNAVALGVSPDSTFSHCKFINEHGLKVRLLSDIHSAATISYGAWGPRIMEGVPVGEGLIRSTFLVSPEGEIARAWKNVTPAGHAEDVLAALGKLQSA